MTSYTLSEYETLTVRSRASDTLEVEALYQPGPRPPMHWHPNQTEHFEILAGTLTIVLDGIETLRRTGDTITISPRVKHRMWNCGESPARVIWRTTPAGRTEFWFARIDALHTLKHADLLDYAAAAREFRDVFRPEVKPRFLAPVALVSLSLLCILRLRLTRRFRH